MSGGPSKDGIPAIDDPKFISVREAKCCADNAASSPISVRRKQHMYPIETPEGKPVPSTFRDPMIPESTDAQTGPAGDASGVTTAGSMVGDVLDSRLNNL